jgi:CPA1 family monovalent cation:H+ antiporter
MLFEGESLFNDGTSLALFLIVLEIARTGWEGFDTLGEGLISFLGMVIGGAIFGIAVGYAFSRLFRAMRGNEYLEITLTMVIAHVTFISSELVSHGFDSIGVDIHLSAIIATTVAAIVVGNYGRYQLTPKVAEYMEHFWGFFAFIANSLIFILIGLLFADLPIDPTQIIIPILATIVVVMVGRAVSIYPVIKIFHLWNKEEAIPMTWQHLLSWGSLRGALAITMVLLIEPSFTVPNWNYPFTVREFLTGITVGCIFFTLFIKATTIGGLIRRFGVDRLSEIEEAEKEESRALVYAKVLLEIDRFKHKRYISEEVYQSLKNKYESRFNEACADCKTFLSPKSGISDALLSLYATGYEKHSLRTLYTYEEISENIYRIILSDLSERQEMIERGKVVPRPSIPKGSVPGISNSEEEYMYFRARMVTSHKALAELQEIAQSDTRLFDQQILKQIIEIYRGLELDAKTEIDRIVALHRDKIGSLAIRFAEAGISKAEDKILGDLSEKEIISSKVESILRAELLSVTK